MERHSLRRRGVVKTPRGRLADTLFAHEPPPVRYNKSQYQQLRDDLSAAQAGLTTHTIVSPADVQLNAGGRTLVGGLRFTPQAFNSLCGAICPGLHRYLYEVGAQATRGYKSTILVDWNLARSTYNNTVALRFVLLQNLRLLVSEPQQLIVSLIGPEKVNGSLSTFLDGIQAGAAKADTPQQFYAAVRHVHRLQLWYRDPAPLCTVPFGSAGETWLHSATSFSWMAMIHCSMRVSPGFWTRLGMLGVSVREGGAMVRWRNSCNVGSVAEMTAAAFRFQPPMDEIQRDGRRRLERSLGLTAPVTQEKLDACFAALLRPVRHRRVPQQALQQAFILAVEGSGDHHGVRPPSDADRAQCTVGDFLGQVVAMARSLRSAYREVVEELAYDILTGKVL